MAILVSSATMIASDGGNDIVMPTTTPEFVNTNSLNYNLINSTIDFRMENNGVLEYVGASTLPCVISAKYSYPYLTGGLIGGICIYKNGIQLLDSINYDNRAPEIINYKLDLEPNDYIELWANSNILQLPVYLTQCQLSVIGWSLIG